jgi:hypothetical protein
MTNHKKLAAISCLAGLAIIVVLVLGLVAVIVTYQLFFAPSRSEAPPRPAPTPVADAALTKSRYIENLGLKLGLPHESKFEPGADGFHVWATVENYGSCTVSDVELTAKGIKDEKELIDRKILVPARDIRGTGNEPWPVVFTKFAYYLPGDLLDQSSGQQKPIARLTNITVEISRIRLADASCQY